jgi:mRNA interferase RelE/StbE
MAYQIEIDSVALRFLKKLPKSEYQVISSDIEALAVNPRPSGYIKMTHARDLYRIRTGTTGEFRIVYTIEDKRLLIKVVRVGNRKEIYQKI